MPKTLLLITTLWLLSCKGSNKHTPPPATAAKDTAHKPATFPPTYPDIFYEEFIDSILPKDGIVFSKTPIEAGMAFTWSEENGCELREPLTFKIGTDSFLLDKMDIVNDDDRLTDIWYDVDTAMAFTLAGRRYAYARAFYHNCNGTFCQEEFHFIADLSAHKLHVFQMFAPPTGPLYFGDINRDSILDFVVPYSECVVPEPYCDTTQTVTLIAYTLDRKGKFAPLQNAYKCTRQFVVLYNIPGNTDFRILTDMWDR